MRGVMGTAKKRGLDFNLTEEDCKVPEFCPVLGIKLEKKTFRTDHSPTVDRVDNSLGYVKGNVRVISWRANRIKNDGSAEEHRLIAKYIEEHRLIAKYMESSS